MKRFAIISPAPIRGSGGVARIFIFADALARSGFECDVYIFDAGSRAKEHIKKEAKEFYSATGFEIFCGHQLDGNYDYVMATRWDTAKFVRDASSKNKLYLVQDFEACFNPVGDGTILAENSYLYGLQTITYGRWLATKLNREYGNVPYYLDFSSDLNSFFVKKSYSKRLESPPSICFIYQHDKPRRCPLLGIEALGIVKNLRPDVDIYLVGSDENPPLWFEYKNAGLLDLAGLNDLYNNCHVGLCLSSSNPSCNPFDMMAAGLPSVELYRENNLYDLPEGGVILAHQTPESIAEALIYLISNPDVLQGMSEFGVKYMEGRAAKEEVKDFLSIVSEIDVSGSDRRVSSDELPERYSAAAVVASVCKTVAVEAHVQGQFNSFREDACILDRGGVGGRISSYGMVGNLSSIYPAASTGRKLLALVKKIVRRFGV